ncbi:MAG: hypothetical protein H6736_20530 [Alphaproteobacteria bacterium]|nr:hypothetical protein [Alphaproteobacteria bacterium]
MSGWARAAGLVAAVGVYVWRAWPSLWTTVDDAWISARYAAQAAAGNGLVYNAGEPPVEGTTNTLWTLWLVVGHRLDVAPETWMVGSGLAFGALTVVLAGLLAGALAPGTPGVAVLAAALVALDVHHAVVSTNGLESAMFHAALLGSAWAALVAPGRALWVAGALAGLLATVRPEGAALGLVAVGLAATREDVGPRGLLPVLGPLVAAVVALTLWRLATYGALVPNTLAAKAYKPTGALLWANLAYLRPDGGFWGMAALLGLLGLWAGRRDPRRWVLAVGALAVVVVASRVVLWMPGGRLLVPALLLATVGVVSGATTRFGALVAGLALAGSLAAPFTSVEATVRRLDRNHSVRIWNGAAVAGRFLSRRLPAGSWLAVRDAGVLAYFVGTEVRVAELHERALTRPHPGGAAADVLGYTPVAPEVVALTQRTAEDPGFAYSLDREIFERLDVPYVYVGRVSQHYRRYYDLYVRADLGVRWIPPEIVVSRAGPAPPR